MISYRELTPDLWPALERLFGANGACGGCWCMWWRVERGGRLWEETKGEPARKRMRDLVRRGAAHGILAFDGEEPVGWCAFGRRAEYPRVERVKAYRRDDVEGVFSIPCFFIRRSHRGRGVARGLLAAAVEAIRRQGGRVIEAYPVTTTKDGRPVAAAFAYTGPLSIYREAGFREVQRLAPTRPLVRKEVGA